MPLPPDAQSFDVVVVGLGPAGAAAEVPYVPSDGDHRKDRPCLRRYLALRVRHRQGQLFADGHAVQHFAVVTNRTEDGLTLLRWHREKTGTVEHTHHVLKNDLAGAALPSGKFGANAAWFRLNVLTYNLLTALKRLALPGVLLTARPKRLRFLVFNAVGKVIHHARRIVLRLTTATNDDIADSLETIGFGRNVLMANVGLIGAGWLFREHEEGNKLMRTALVSLEAQLFTEDLVGLTKFAVGRARPDAGEGTQSYDPFEGFDKSFPSRHAARSFAVAAVFADAYPQPIPFLAYTGATLISLSRIYLNEHFASDVFAGAALGLAIGKVLSWRHQHPEALRGWSVLPFVPDARGGLGLTVEYQFGVEACRRSPPPAGRRTVQRP